jgi:hypothetical protein
MASVKLKTVIVLIDMSNYMSLSGVRVGEVGWGTALQAGRSWFRFPMVLLGIFIDSSFRPHYGLGVDSASDRGTTWGGKGGRCVGLKTLPPYLEILGAWNSWSSKGL